MKMAKYLQSVVLSATSVALFAPVVRAEDSAASVTAEARGTIVGIVTNAAKVPVGGATVTATRAGRHSFHGVGWRWHLFVCRCSSWLLVADDFRRWLPGCCGPQYQRGGQQGHSS